MRLANNDYRVINDFPNRAVSSLQTAARTLNMNLVGRAFGSVSKTWNSINPATLSGAIDVIVVEQENGELACSPFHVRFGKFQLLRPSEKKVSCHSLGKFRQLITQGRFQGQ